MTLSLLSSRRNRSVSVQRGPRATVDFSGVKTDRLTCWKTAAVALGAGAASGFFRIGGGFLIVPGLMLSTGMPMISADGSSLLAVGTFGLATAINYAVSGLIDWRIAAEFIGGGVFGGFGGMLLATRLASRRNLLNRVFAVLILMEALYVLYQSRGAVAFP